jgi:hypothetical protein
VASDGLQDLVVALAEVAVVVDDAKVDALLDWILGPPLPIPMREAQAEGDPLPVARM